MKVTLGGDRLGSGKKEKLELSHYYRSTFNLEQDFKSSLAPGILYPCLNLIGTNGDEFDIDIDSIFRTIPTKAPLFGSFKAQIDIFACPFRLYQGILHNNPIDIGLKMNQVYLPKLEISVAADSYNTPTPVGSDFYNSQISTSALLKYLGLSGIGFNTDNVLHPSDTVKRKINAIPALAYYDIFKNYYSNKQETNAYVLTPDVPDTESTIIDMFITHNGEALDLELEQEFEFVPGDIITIKTTNPDLKNFTLNGVIDGNTVDLDLETLVKEKFVDYIDPTTRIDENTDKYIFIKANENTPIYINSESTTYVDANTKVYVNSKIKMEPFELANIDKMRNRILKLNELGDELVIDDSEELLPYSTLTTALDPNKAIFKNAFKQNGLVVKTYQSDLFNNWINTDWIDGENGIAALSAVDVSDGSLNMDALNLAQKVYNMLNRIAVSGGTYEDWQEAVYDESAVRKAESPMYCGGMSAEIMFEEIISTAETNVNGDFQPLGSLGGRGKQVLEKGGKQITVKCNEPTLIMGIVSLTPRICQTQGNEWYLTELDTLNDLHKPGLDGIGFQDLIGEQMAWWDTKLNTVSGMSRSTVGKVPAWINYQTAVDKAYGDFAEASGKAFMVLSRNYEMEMKQVDVGVYEPVVKDFTTYIDPAKYNYAFAYTDLAAQNFWAQIHFKIVARRKMSAHQIPNL